MIDLIIAGLVIVGIIVAFDALEKLEANKWKQTIIYKLLSKKKKRKKK